MFYMYRLLTIYPIQLSQSEIVLKVHLGFTKLGLVVSLSYFFT